MSEMPALAALMATVYCVDRYVRGHERRDLWLGIVFAFTSVTAKLLTAFMLPVLALHFVGRRGLGWPLKGRMLLALAGATVAVAAAIEILTTLTPYNMRWVSIIADTPFNVSDLGYAWSAMDVQITWPVALLAGAGVLLAVARKDARTALFIAWVLTFAAVVVFLTKRFAPDRFTVYWIPALCALAASTIGDWKSRFMQTATVIILAICLGFETLAASRVDLEGAGGYEEAARYVVQHTDRPSGVLFSGDLDMGYFTFFVRSHDAERRLIVLRSDKLLTTSLVQRVAFKELIHDPAEIDRALMGLGIRFVVLEDRPSSSRVQNWLRDRLRQPPFVERQRIPLQSRNRILEHMDLAIFENTAAVPADPDRPLTLDLPIVGRTINLRLGDAMAGPGRRE